MSNYLAIATVTAALQSLLVEHVAPDIIGTDITTKRPAAPAGGSAGPSINVYMYQATPNQAWSNKDLRTRRPQGDLIKHGQAALDLNYVFSFYGDESQLIPQRLLGSTIRTLVDYPLLSQDMIRDSVVASEISGLEETTLEEQIQLVRFVPSAMTTENLSQIWSTFFQVPYSLSFAYQATAVLIEGKQAGRAALPVRRRVASVSQNRPIIKKIDHQEREQPITIASNLIVRGQQLIGYGDTEIRIGESHVRPRSVKSTQLLLQFSQLTDAELAELRPGVQGLQVIQSSTSERGGLWKSKVVESTVESNVVPIVLCPTILGGNEGIAQSNMQRSFRGNHFAGVITVEIDLTVSRQQRAFLVLNRVGGEDERNSCEKASETYIFAAEKRPKDTHRLEFKISEVSKGEYLVRVQVDGAESPLLDDDERYIGPMVAIGME